MTDLPTEDSVEQPYQKAAEQAGGGPGAGPELNDDVAQQSASGSSGPDADEHVGQEAPASEGELPPGL